LQYRDPKSWDPRILQTLIEIDPGIAINNINSAN